MTPGNYVPPVWRPSPSGGIVAVHEDARLSAQSACAPLLKDAVELMPTTAGAALWLILK
jgi:hypothetical protein